MIVKVPRGPCINRERASEKKKWCFQGQIGCCSLQKAVQQSNRGYLLVLVNDPQGCLSTGIIFTINTLSVFCLGLSCHNVHSQKRRRGRYNTVIHTRTHVHNTQFLKRLRQIIRSYATENKLEGVNLCRESGKLTLSKQVLFCLCGCWPRRVSVVDKALVLPLQIIKSIVHFSCWVKSLSLWFGLPMKNTEPASSQVHTSTYNRKVLSSTETHGTLCEPVLVTIWTIVEYEK